MKPIFKSKTFGVALINIAALKFIPGAKEWVAENPEAYGELVTALIIILRAITNKATKWKIWQK